MTQRNHAVPASYLVLRKDDEILLMRRKGSGYYDGWYCVPAGHVEEGELPIDCLVRETKEEIGIDLERASIRLVHSMYRTKSDATGDRADYFFVATEWQGSPVICEPDKCDDLAWFPVDALPPNTMHHVAEAIWHGEKNIAYSELGRERIMANPSQVAAE